jgi:serine/threonine protein kinase
LIGAEGSLEARRAVRLALKISYALEATYRRGLIHRDIKPQSVLVTDYG